jgi:hypothetical protein
MLLLGHASLIPALLSADSARAKLNSNVLCQESAKTGFRPERT